MIYWLVTHDKRLEMNRKILRTNLSSQFCTGPCVNEYTTSVNVVAARLRSFGSPTGIKWAKNAIEA